MQKPSGSASRADWADYAIHLGYDRKIVAEMTRNSIRDLAKSGPKQEEDAPAPVIDEAGAEETAAVEEPAGPDYSQFLTPTGPGEEPGAGAAAAQDADEQTGQQPTPTPTGQTVAVGGGGARAVCVLGTYQVTDEDGVRHTVSRGEVLDGPEWAVARGVQLGVLQRL